MSTVILGVDFTSAPSRRKPITLAVAKFSANCLAVERIDRIEGFDAFESMLSAPAPWVGGFDFPFGLPRELVTVLGWPTTWPELIEHVQKVGKQVFKDALNEIRVARPYGSRYIARRGDVAAGSSSSMKLVNPPVGLMFFEGAHRLLRAGVSVVPCAPRAGGRIALEAYPGFLARKITTDSYKKDGKEGMSSARRAVRDLVVGAITSASAAVSHINVVLPTMLHTACIDDGSGDTLDAVLCAIQAAQCVKANDANDTNGASFDMPPDVDSLEGWIATVIVPRLESPG